MPILPYQCRACGEKFEIWRRDPEELGEVRCASCDSDEVSPAAPPKRTSRGGFVQIVGTVRAKDGEEAARKIREGDTIESEEVAELLAILPDDPADDEVN
jgi:hypothetical protein